MVDVQPLDAHTRLEGSPDTGLGRYQSLVVTVVAGLILALASVPDVTAILR